MDRLGIPPAANRGSATHNQHRNFITITAALLAILANIDRSLRKSGGRT